MGGQFLTSGKSECDYFQRIIVEQSSAENAVFRYRHFRLDIL
jgi:hypothetical protein